MLAQNFIRILTNVHLFIPDLGAHASAGKSAPVRKHDGRMLSSLGFHKERRKIDRVMARSRCPSVFRQKLSQRHKHRGIGRAGISDHQRCTGNPPGYRGPALDGTVAACAIPGPAQVRSPNFPAGCAGVCQIEF